MNYKRENELRKAWDEIKKKRSEFHKLLAGKAKPDSFDVILFYQAVSLIMESLAVREKQLKNAPNKVGDIGKCIIKEVEKEFGDIAPEIACFLISENEKLPVSQRLDAIEKIRLVSWKSLFNQRHELEELSKRFPNSLNREDMGLLFQCISLVVLELDMKDKEIEILDDLYE